MREYIFRGKRVDNGEWVFGCLVTGFDERKDRESVDITYQQFEGASMDYPYPTVATFYHEVIPETVGQYTGLKDKHGKMIFEGDVCKWPSGHISQIVFDQKACFTAKSITQSHDFGRYGIVPKYIQVIGNIHDNLELLK